jgi:Fur family transcriptional regulator, ferric uptake regulator
MESSAAQPHYRAGGAGARGSRQRIALTALLMDLDEFRSAQDLHFELRGRGESVGLTTVYRALQQMAGDGLVDKARAESGEVMYRWSFRGLHHHLMCRQCGLAVEVQAAHVEQWAGEIAREHAFSDITCTIEIVGLCARCTGSWTPAPSLQDSNSVDAQ